MPDRRIDVGRLTVRRYPQPCLLGQPHLFWSPFVVGGCTGRWQATWASADGRARREVAALALAASAATLLALWAKTT